MRQLISLIIMHIYFQRYSQIWQCIWIQKGRNLSMSEKNRDVKNRWRTVTVAFRLSPEENEELTNRVKMCGCRTRQEYIIQSILHQKVVATGNPLMLVSFRQNLQHIEAELERLQKVDEMDSELLTPIRTMLEILEAFRETPRTLAGMERLTVNEED